MNRSSIARVFLTLSFCLNLGTAARADGTSAVTLITADHAQGIYRHLIETHWIPQTGLFESFPDSGDLKMSQQASLYEQAAMGLLAVRFGDMERARALYQFMKQAWDAAPQKPGPRAGVRGLSNFYNADFGTDGIEKTVHVGPNAWAGLFAARLANVSKDPESLRWAVDVAYWIANSVPHQDGAVAMGPVQETTGAPWRGIFSTENNISYDALLTELLRSPMLEADQRHWITKERDAVENWLVHTAFDRSSYNMSRGRNPHGEDSIHALDTTTWLISVIGPARLAARGINPFRLMEQAGKSFEVTVAGREGVDATDQAEANFVYMTDHPTQGAARPSHDGHRLIWYEGLGQYILACSAMAEYAASKGETGKEKLFREKARRLTEEFDAAALKNVKGRVAYPYATAGKLYRDGWRAPEPSAEGPASSLISAIWRCFAGLGTDPFSGKQIGAVRRVSVEAPEGIHLAAKPPKVLYGTSEEMTSQAWAALGRGDQKLAVEQAKATIQEWSSFAMRLQQKKMRDVGQTINYDGQAADRNAIFSYWALNDVGACYFILGKVLDQQGDYLNAARAFQQVATHYSLAQVWDPQGWFWAPMDAISNEYVSRDPRHYGNVVPEEVAQRSTVGKQPF